MFAIVKIGAKQYTVKSGDVIEVDLLAGAVGDVLNFDQVLLLKDDTSTSVGKPFVKGAVVKAKIIEHTQGEKIAVRRYKHKVRHRRHIGFRAQLTKLEITSIDHT